MTAQGHRADFQVAVLKGHLRCVFFGFVWQVEAGFYAVVEVAQIAAADLRTTQIDLAFGGGNPRTGQLRGAADGEIHTLTSADTGDLFHAVLVRVFTIDFQRWLVVGASQFALVVGRGLLGGQAQIHVDLGVSAGVLTAFDRQITRHVAADVTRIDPRAVEARITAAVQHHSVSLDLAVLLGSALQVVHADLGPGIEAVVAADFFIGGGRCAFAQIAAGIQRDVPVVAAVGGLRGLLNETALLRVDADVWRADLSALQVHRIAAQRDAILAVELATG